MDTMFAASQDASASAQLRDWIAGHQRIFVLTGAGCSTGSGIPDYRDGNGDWKRAPPMTWQAFTGDQNSYRRYWARSSLGWPRFAQARAGAAHLALVALERQGRVACLVTQNVDGLHQQAGATQVIDLHGRLDSVVCLGCGLRLPRHELQQAITAANPDWRATMEAIAPDGDADIDAAAIEGFRAPFCGHCNALLKPDVVFFGENVPRQRLSQALDALHGADAMLVVGSSLMVYSGFRFARLAHQAGLPLAIVNRGRTRADALAGLKLDADIAAAFAFVANRTHPLVTGEDAGPLPAQG